MQSAAKKIMASRMFHGGSAGRRPESFWKKTNQGNLMPACRKTPAEAAASRYQTTSRCCRAGGFRDHRLRYEAGGERERRDRQRADDAASRRQRHGAEQSAEIGAFALAGHVEHRARRHQQQRLVDDVGEGVRGGAVERHLGADADAATMNPTWLTIE